MESRAFPIILALALASAAGCRGDAEAGHAMVRDSAGVRIVEITPEAWPPPEAWIVDPEPAVDIGVRDGDPDYTLYEVRGVTETPDGEILVIEWDPRLRYYSADGTHLRTLDREGHGPGEAPAFMGLIRYRGDSLAIVTERMMGTRGRTQLLILSAEGEYGRNVDGWYPGRPADTENSAGMTQNSMGIRAALSTGQFVAVGAAVIRWEGLANQLVPGTTALMVSDPRTERFDTLALVQTTLYEARPLESRKRELVLNDPAAPHPQAHGPEIYWAHGDRYRVDIYRVSDDMARDSTAPPGGLARSYRILAPRQPLGDEYRQRYMDTLVALNGATGAAAARDYERYESLQSPDSVPAVRDMKIDAEGNIWLEQHRVLGLFARENFRRRGSLVETEPSPWIVLDPDGSLIGQVLMPPGLAVHEIGSDYVLGVRADSMGVQYVRKHSITK